jgi:dTDP-4-amino-4,6-dideoxygalactose transaminase
VSILSFHATKVFTTFEGGAIVCRDVKTKRRIDFLKNFGFADEVTVMAPGINGKMNEIQAALGLLQLKHLGKAVDRRRQIAHRYRDAFSSVAGIRCMDEPSDTKWNYAYFPILVCPEYPMSRDALYANLRSKNIYARRYFYPLISSFPMYRHLPSACPENLPVAHGIARQIICLPIYPDLSMEQQDYVIQVVREPL